MLLKISYQPERCPMLFSYYVIDETSYNSNYKRIFEHELTIMLNVNAKQPQYSYNLELYLPACQIECIYDRELINSFKRLHQDNFFGNIDLLDHVLTYVDKWNGCNSSAGLKKNKLV